MIQAPAGVAEMTIRAYLCPSDSQPIPACAGIAGLGFSRLTHQDSGFDRFASLDMLAHHGLKFPAVTLEYACNQSFDLRACGLEWEPLCCLALYLSASAKIAPDAFCCV